MTRAERIERAARTARQCLVAEGSPRRLLNTAVAILDEALALPPDPQPRRLTGDDVMAMAEWLKRGDIVRTESQMADFLNTRIFKETNDDPA